MGTSRSDKTGKKWTAGASIYSGRPDPTWTVPKRLALQLEEIWACLPESSDEPALGPPLGYRGSFLEDSSGRRWFTYGGVVTLTTGAGSELRKDKGRAFETLLWKSAPKGLLTSTGLDTRGENSR
jgi:hypothetical protein